MNSTKSMYNETVPKFKLKRKLLRENTRVSQTMHQTATI